MNKVLDDVYGISYPAGTLEIGMPGETERSEWPLDWADRDKPTCWLPHSCDEWVIGGVADAERLIADLREFIKRAEGEAG